MKTNEEIIEQITLMQKIYGLTQLQKDINSGQVWLMEGFYGRQANDALESGACFLPEERRRDYYGSTVPSRNDLEPGTKGTLLNSQEFWGKVVDGEIILAEDVEEEVK
jgi:hypothetical protein